MDGLAVAVDVAGGACKAADLVGCAALDCEMGGGKVGVGAGRNMIAAAMTSRPANDQTAIIKLRLPITCPLCGWTN